MRLGVTNQIVGDFILDFVKIGNRLMSDLKPDDKIGFQLKFKVNHTLFWMVFN